MDAQPVPDHCTYLGSRLSFLTIWMLWADLADGVPFQGSFTNPYMCLALFMNHDWFGDINEICNPLF